MEGHGEVRALPELIRRVGLSMDPPLYVEVPVPVRAPRDKVVKEGELERAVRLAASKAGPGGGVLVLLDADESCPADLGPRLLERAKAVLPDIPVAAVLAKVEYEAWFLASIESLAGHKGLRADVAPPADPEGIRNAKGWLTENMEGSRAYSETLDQVAFTALFDMAAARSAGSFDKCFRDVTRLLEELSN